MPSAWIVQGDAGDGQVMWRCSDGEYLWTESRREVPGESWSRDVTRAYWTSRDGRVSRFVTEVLEADAHERVVKACGYTPVQG